MKNFKSKTFVAAFLSGILVGVSFMAFMAFRTASPESQTGTPTTVSVSQANELYRNYKNTTMPINDVFRGMCIGMDQYNAMGTIMQAGSNVKAFRVYMGKDHSGNGFGIVVGVDDDGKDITTGSILKTSQGWAGPCPTICDVASPITAEN